MVKVRQALAAVLITAVAGVGMGFGSGRLTAPERGAVEHHPGHWVVTGADCPTEDSCTVDYNAGEWSIEEVTP